MYYSEFHNHKWARNLAHARTLWQNGSFEALYRGEPLGTEDYYPGLRVMGAYWVSVEHEMPMRLQTLLKGAGRPDWSSEPAIAAQAKEFLARYLDDMRELIARENILPLEQFETLVKTGLETPADWAGQMHTWQQESEEALAKGTFSLELFETWLHSCLRSVANYNRFLILGGVCAAALYKEGGEAALRAAVGATAEEFMWEISKAFYNTVLPAAGFEDIGDLMELGLRGMFSDQWYVSGKEREEGETTIRESILKNCDLSQRGGMERFAQDHPGLRYLPLLRSARSRHDDDLHAADGLPAVPAYRFAGHGRPGLCVRAENRTRRRHGAYLEGAGKNFRRGGRGINPGIDHRDTFVRLVSLW
jgi:hypothetical protein